MGNIESGPVSRDDIDTEYEKWENSRDSEEKKVKIIVHSDNNEEKKVNTGERVKRMLKKAKEAHGEGDNENGLKILNKLIDGKVTDNEILLSSMHNVRASIYEALENDEKAIENYEKAIKIYPKNAKALQNIGNFLKREGKFEKADDYFKQAIVANPDQASTYFNRGGMFEIIGKSNDALHMYSTFLKIEKDEKMKRLAYIRIAHLYHKNQQFKNAEEYYTKAVDMSRDTLSLTNRGCCYLKLKRYEEALSDFEDVLTINPESPVKVFIKHLKKRTSNFENELKDIDQSKIVNLNKRD